MGNPCTQILVERKEEMSGKMKITGIAVLAMIVLAGTAIAQGPGGWSPQAGGSHGGSFEMDHGPGVPGPGGPGQQGGFGMERLEQFRMMFRHIDLTEEQIEEIRSITENAREEAMGIMEAAGRPEDHTPFMDIFTSATLTVSDLEETVSQNSEIREAMQDVVFEAIVDIHNVLTLEQLDKLAEMAEEHSGAMGPGAGMDHGSGMGHPMR
jgi:Spy/CpxP family protein refolding chaperone